MDWLPPSITEIPATGQETPSNVVEKGKPLDHPGAKDCHFDMLNGIHDKQPEFAVKYISPPYFAESGIGRELFFTCVRVDHFESVPIGTQAVVIYPTKTSN